MPAHGALVLDAATSLERAVAAPGAPGNHAAAGPAPDSPQARAEMDAYRAQVTVIDLVLRAMGDSLNGTVPRLSLTASGLAPNIAADQP